ncbi:MAG: DUF2490 domain-containing protein [Pseudomonadota bacterium]
MDTLRVGFHRRTRWRAGVLSTLLILLSCPPVWAASEQQNWLAFATNGPMGSSDHLRFWFDGHARFRDESSSLGVSILRPAIGWQLQSGLTLWAGYARVVARRSGPDAEENRFWQQATYPVGEVFGGRLGGRTRIEQRLFEGFDDTGHRIRQFWRWSRPIGQSDWSWMVANETFINIDDSDFGQRAGYQQNRLYLGFAWQAAPELRLEVSYLNNHIDRVGADDLDNHNVYLGLLYLPR